MKEITYNGIALEVDAEAESFRVIDFEDIDEARESFDEWGDPEMRWALHFRGQNADGSRRRPSSGEVNVYDQATARAWESLENGMMDADDREAWEEVFSIMTKELFELAEEAKN